MVRLRVPSTVAYSYQPHEVPIYTPSNVSDWSLNFQRHFFTGAGS